MNIRLGRRKPRTNIVFSGFGGSLSISSPVTNQIFQRDSITNTCDILITGSYTYRGGFSAIEARFNGGAWQTIINSLNVGTFNFSAYLEEQPVGQGVLEVRFKDSLETVETVENISIGDVFLVAGQSNASGRFTSLQNYSHPTLKASMFRQTGTWAQLTDPTDSDFSATGVGSVWPLVATAICAEINVPVGFITTADGSTGLVNPASWVKGATQYNAALSRINASGVNSIKAILWFLGERDSQTSVDITAHANALSLMLDNMQTDLGSGFSNMKLMCGQIGSNTVGNVTETNLNNVRLYQQDRWDNDPDIYAGPITYDLILRDGLHFADAEVTRLANRWWRMIQHYFYGGTEGRSLTYSTSSFSGSVVTVELSGGVGNTLLGATTSTGWRVVDANGTCTISSVSAIDKTLTITLSNPLVAPVYVSFGSGNDGLGSSLKDNSTIEPQPPEVFIYKAVSDGSPPPTLDDDVNTYQTNVIAEGGSISDPNLEAINNFVLGLKSDSIWDKIDLIHLTCGISGFDASRVRLKCPVGMTVAAEYSGFVSGDYSSSTGLTGGTSKHINTRFNPSTLSDVNNFGMYACIANNQATNATSWLIGSGGSGASNTVVGRGSSGTQEQAGIATSGSALVIPTTSSLSGMKGVQTNGSRLQKYYHNGTEIGTSVTADLATFANTNLYALARSTNGTANSFCIGVRLLSIFLTKGLSATEVNNLYSRWNTLKTALGV